MKNKQLQTSVSSLKFRTLQKQNLQFATTCQNAFQIQVHFHFALTLTTRTRHILPREWPLPGPL